MKYQIINSGFFILTTWIIIFTSCSKSVYVQSDDFGTSKYIVYKDNYKYIEKTKTTDFEIWGKYYLTDTTIVFELKDKEKVPYNYLGANVKRIYRNDNSQSLSISVVDKVNKEPVPFASIGAKNNLGEYVAGEETNIEGEAELKKSDEIEVLEIEFIGYAKQLIDFKANQDFNLIIEMEELKPGGRLSEGCLITFLDVLLEYRIQEKSDIKEFERNGIVFKQEMNTP